MPRYIASPSEIVEPPPLGCPTPMKTLIAVTHSRDPVTPSLPGHATRDMAYRL